MGNLGSDGVTSIEFRAEGNKDLHYWFGHARKEIIDRLCVFGKTGSDGSMAAFWLTPDGTQKIVHLGSGSGSTMVCVLAENFVDFLRLLAIGYSEIAWDSDLVEAPSERLGQDGNKYSSWVCKTFKVQIPRKGTDIIKNISRMGDADSLDEFEKWTSETV